MEIFDLPVHPLIVHAAVVLVPLAALGALLLVALPSQRKRYGGLAVAFAVAAAAAALAARLTGPVLADMMGMTGSRRIETHRMLGTWMPWPAILLAVVLPLFLYLSRRQSQGQRSLGYLLAGALTVSVALVSLVLIGLVGHSGATAVWGR